MSQNDPKTASRVVDDETFMSVKDLQSYMADVDAARASKAMSAMDQAAKARKEMIAELMKPIELSSERRDALIHRIKSAAARGETELMILRFPVELTTDHGRAINNNEDTWPESLLGRPRQVHDIWKEYLQPAGYKLKAMIVDWPGGLPGEIGMYLAWS
jgi:hypothetical protein